MVQFRKSKSFGPVRITASKKGFGVSAGAGPLRISRGADAKVRRTIRAPGTGVYDTRVIGGKAKSQRGTTRNRTAPPSRPTAFTARPAANRKDPRPGVEHTLKILTWCLIGLGVILAITGLAEGVYGLTLVAGLLIGGGCILNIRLGRSEASAKPPHGKSGWSPNPDGSDDLRYWDGSKWTQHTHPKV